MNVTSTAFQRSDDPHCWDLYAGEHASLPNDDEAEYEGTATLKEIEQNARLGTTIKFVRAEAVR